MKAAQGTASGSAGAACAPAPRLAGGRRGPRERIDIDTNIARARAEMKAAQKAVAKARAAAKQEKRKKHQVAQKGFQPERLRFGKDCGIEAHRALGSDIDRAASAWHSVCQRILFFCDGMLHSHRVASASGGGARHQGAGRELRVGPGRGR